MAERNDRFDRILMSLMQQIDGGTPKFLGIIFDFMKRKTDFGLQEAKAMVNFALSKHLPSTAADLASKNQ